MNDLFTFLIPVSGYTVACGNIRYTNCTLLIKSLGSVWFFLKKWII